MTQIKLFGTEAQAIVERVKEVKKERVPRKSKTPSIMNLKFEQSQSRKRLKELESQDETGWSEFDLSIKGKEVNMRLVNNHISYYQGQIDAIREPFNLLLLKWREFIINLCKEKGQEIDKIWFDDSSPYDCEIGLRLKEHRCWYACVEFRFGEGKMKAYDSHFGGGTSFVDFIPNEDFAGEEKTKEIIRNVLERVFNKECDSEYNEVWNKREAGDEHREINIDEKGWKND